jgi:hypothetical protein
MRLSPYDAESGRWHFYLGAAGLYGGQVADAIDQLRKSVQLNPDYNVAHLFLAGRIRAQSIGLIVTVRAPGPSIRANARSANPARRADLRLRYRGPRLPPVQSLPVRGGSDSGGVQRDIAGRCGDRHRNGALIEK